MAASVAYYSGDPLDNVLEKRDDLEKSHAQHVLTITQALVERLPTYTAALAYPTNPPTYEDTLNDLPPDYTLTEAFARCTQFQDDLPPAYSVVICTDSKQPLSYERSRKTEVDLTGLYNIRAHGGKKAKQAAKAANKAKWADSGDEGEGSKEGGEQGEGGDGGSAGGGAGGGDDGGGGGDDDFWNDFSGGKKNKKGKKKGKGGDDDEEEKKDEAASGGAGEANFWDDLDGGKGAAGDANGEDEWATLGAGKKKGKKGKKVGVCLASGTILANSITRVQKQTLCRHHRRLHRDQLAWTPSTWMCHSWT